MEPGAHRTTTWAPAAPLDTDLAAPASRRAPRRAAGSRTGAHSTGGSGLRQSGETSTHVIIPTQPGGGGRTGEHATVRTGERAAVHSGGPRNPSADRPPGAFFRPARPASGDRAGRWVLTAAFWLGLAGAIYPWWHDTTAAALSDTASALIAAGRITGLLAGYVLLVQILLMSRVDWLEAWVGARRLLLWHRELGGFLVVAVLAHAVLITLGYARSGRTSFFGETWTIFTKYEDMVSAFIAAGILVAIGLLGIRALRRAMPYELWYYLHVASYLVLILGYGHQFATGQQLFRQGLARWYWIGLYGFVIVAVVAGRVISPLLLNLWHRLRVADVVDEGPNLFSIYITGRHLGSIDAKAGQFFRWRFMTMNCWWQAHPFSLSAAPNDRWLRLTVRTVGDHTNRLRRLRPGVKVFAEGPAGEFTADRRTRARALLIAGGSGIAPIRALLEELPPGTVMIYRTSRTDDVAFHRELEWLAQAREARLCYVVGHRDDPAPRRLFTPGGLRELVPDVRRRDVYLCGPPGLVETSRALLRRLRVPPRQIHLDAFEF
jgi:predicted ferric reductase